MVCLTLPEIDLGEWGTALRAKMRGKRYPLGGMFELTDRCNLSCTHCYINQPAALQSARERELTTSQVTGILDQLADAGSLFLTFTGGELFLRPDFPEIYIHARQRGLLVKLFTNGTTLTPKIADLLAEYRPHMVEITLYGATQQTYEQVTQNPGSFARCMRGIDLLMERGLPLELKSVILTSNRHELDEMRAFADRLGVHYRYDGVLWPRLDGSCKPFGYQLPIEEIISLDLEDEERRNEWVRLANSHSDQKLRAEYIYSCGAGIYSYHIDSSGHISACTMSRKPSYNLLEMSFQEAWERLGEIRKLKRQMDTPCKTCTVGDLCPQCPGWSQAVHNDDETPVEFICNLAHTRKAMVLSMEAEYQGDLTYEQETL